MLKKDAKLQTCCFFGHRKIIESDSLKDQLYRAIENLIIEEKVDTFLFGSKSAFDKLCLAVVTKLKQKYPHIKRIYVRAEYQHIGDEYRKYLLERYEDTYYPDNIENAGKAVYIKRNYQMIEKSKFCVIYYDENYIPPRRKNSKKEFADYQPQSGTKLAYEYAVRKGLNIINIMEYPEKI